MNYQFNVRVKLQPLHAERELIKMKERVMEGRRGIDDLYVELNNESTDGREEEQSSLMRRRGCELKSSQLSATMSSSKTNSCNPART